MPGRSRLIIGTKSCPGFFQQHRLLAKVLLLRWPFNLVPMAKYYCFVGQVSNHASQPYFPSVSLISFNVLHTPMQSLAYVCARSCIRLCKVLHKHVQHLDHTVSLQSPCHSKMNRTLTELESETLPPVFFR